MSGHMFSVSAVASAMLRFGVVPLVIYVAGCTPATVLTAVEIRAPDKIIELKGRYKREYVLGANDKIDVVVRGDEDASRVVVIGTDGAISLPIAGRIVAAGLTVEGLDDVLTERYAERLVNPEVTVIPVTVREPQVYVLGQVATPGPVPFKDAATALEALAHAGDMNLSAAKNAVALIRLEEDGIIRVRVVEPADAGQPGPYIALSALQLEPEDILFVPERSMSQASRILTEFSAPFVAIANALQPFLTLKLIRTLDSE